METAFIDGGELRFGFNSKIGFILPDNLSTLPIKLAGSAEDNLFVGSHYTISEAPQTKQLIDSKVINGKLIGLFNPTMDLAAAEAESELVTGFYSDVIFLKPNLTAREFLSKVGQGPVECVYTATHGSFGLGDKVGLKLGNTSQLTASDVLNFRGKLDVSLWVLSGCELGKTGHESVEFELSNLASVLLGKGVNAVIAALWKVSDNATALLMSRTIFEHKNSGEELPVAFKKAQNWLRQSNVNELQSWLIEVIDDNENVDWQNTENILANLSDKNGDEVLYSHPYYWAGFTYYGA